MVERTGGFREGSALIPGLKGRDYVRRPHTTGARLNGPVNRGAKQLDWHVVPDARKGSVYTLETKVWKGLETRRIA